MLEETTNPDVFFPAGSVPAEAEWTEGIRLPVHALVLSMWEHDLAYDIGSAPFVWNALYYALSLYGEMDDRAQRTEEALLLPSEAVNDFARALFSGKTMTEPEREMVHGFRSSVLRLLQTNSNRLTRLWMKYIQCRF